MTTDLTTGHARFRETFERNSAFFRHLAEEGQSPSALWIGCVDSRVVPEQIVGAAPGDLLVLRNVANIVPPDGVGADAVGSVLEFAVGVLRVPHIIVCGHTYCGGLAALQQDIGRHEAPHLARWVEWARPAQSEVEAAGTPAAEQPGAVARANALWQRRNLATYHVVSRAAAAGSLTLHAWVYDLARGEIWRYDDAATAWMALAGEEAG